MYSDPCAYIRTRDGNIEIVTVWVDDLLLFANNSDVMNKLKAELTEMFDITDLGEPRKIVGIEIDRDRAKGTIKISQSKYIEAILKKNGLTDANPVGMPLDPGVKLEQAPIDEDDEPNRSNGYASLIGSLMYAAVATRPDIAYAVQRLSSFTANPGLAHWTAAKRVLRYLAGTRNAGIIYGTYISPNEVERTRFEAYSDADYANDPRDRKSIGGYVFMLGEER